MGNKKKETFMMKLIPLTLTVLFMTSTAFVSSTRAQTSFSNSNLELFNIDWTKGTSQQSGVLMCDDTAFGGVKVVVNGKKDSFQYLFTNDSDATIRSIKEKKSPISGVQTVIIIDSSGGFDMKLENLKTHEIAEIEVSDAC